ncbi:hypothetical protein P0Y43_15200 [Pseudomonas entomophila]|uniref:hypothetical protein n=1 Tax=Pseudomonas entomophila TaxID=312306 RepID=UPI0023D8212B|nr:hypothetical protein [Pseudomonas entomophila]MDF0732061.1 hypothetical protein [Pseudomonas entomophila]
MKKKLWFLSSTLLVSALPALAEEGYMCSTYYEAVQRKEKNIKDYGSDLATLARNKLFDDLKFDTRQCISQCEGQKFKYCNEIAKWISKE